MSDRYEEAGNKGHSYIWEQRWEDAVRAFKLALEGRPKEPDLYDGLATAYRGMDDLEQALDNYQKAARLSKGDPIYLEQVGDIQQKLGEYKQAAQTFMAVGEMRLRERRLDDAVEKWMLAARLDPDLMNAHQRLATIYRKQKKQQQALNELMEVARLYEENGQAVKALETCRSALELDPRNPDVLTAIELLENGQRAFENTGQERKRTSDFSSAVRTADEVGPKNRRTVMPVEDAKRVSREQMAEDVFESGDSGDMDQMQQMALVSQALDYQTRDMTDEAINSYEKLIKGGLKSAAAHFNLGLLYQDKLQFEDAVGQLNTAVKEPEYRLAGHFALGESYRAMGQMEPAISHFITVLKIVDLATVPREESSRLIELYENLAENLVSQEGRDRATAFSNTLVEFLSQKNWEEEVKEARGRLNAMATGTGTMILGDILTAGSSRILESLYNAQQHTQQGMLDTAIEEIYRAIELSPDYLPAHMQMAEILVRKNQLEQGMRKYVTVGDTFRVRGDINGAIHAYKRAVDASPIDIEMRQRLITLLKEEGRLNDVLEQYMGLGEAYYQLAKVDNARETYINALKMAAKGSADNKWRLRLLQRLGDLYVQRLEWRQAVPIYREIRRINPQDEKATATLIDLLFKIGKGSQALKELDRHLVRLAKSGRGRELLGLLEEMVQQRPEQAGLVDRLVRLYMQQKRKQKAIEALDRLGEIQLEHNHNEAATRTIKKIISLKPKNVGDYQQLLSQLS